MSVAVDPGTRALLADGTVAVVRTLGPADAAAVLALHQRLGERDSYLRFLGPRPAKLDEWVEQALTPTDSGAAVGAFLADTLVGVANYVMLPAAPGDAEFALVVDPTVQADGVGTLLLETLAALGRRRGLRNLVAEVSAENTRMLRVLRDLGLPHRMGPVGPEREVVLALDTGHGYLDAVIERERTAATAGLRPLLLPRSVVVVGASRKPGTVGNAVLADLLRARHHDGPTVVAVNRGASEVLGVPAYRSVADLPFAPELAVVCVPATAVPEVVEDCGVRGTRAVVVISSGLSPEEGARVRQSVRRHGLRLVGPNCVGVVNTGAALDATFLRDPVPAGTVGVVTQSGGIGIALTEVLGELGLGVSTLVSTGDKYDVSGNDLLLWWMRDPATTAAVLYLESFGNPRKFGRIARAVARQKPVLAVRSATTEAGLRAAASHTAAAATPSASRDALFAQAGVIAVTTLSEAAGVLAVLAWQPLPRGDRVAVVGNAGGLGVLAADACLRHGLRAAELSGATRARLAELLPATASTRNPVDTTAAVDADTFAACAAAVLDDDGVDAVVVEPVPTAVSDPSGALLAVTAHAARRGKTLVAVRAGTVRAVAAVCDEAGSPVTASFGDPETAVATIAHLAGYAAWRDGEHGEVLDVGGVDLQRATARVAGWMAERPGGGWLEPAAVAELLDCFGLPLQEIRWATDEEAAVSAAVGFGGPVAVKASAVGLLHKSAGGGVLLDVEGAEQARAAWRTLRERFGDRLDGAVVQPMAPPGRELLAGISNDGVFGPLVVFGLGGVDTDLVDDRAVHLAPLTSGDIQGLIGGLRCSPKVFSGVDVGAVADVLARVSRIAEALPEVAELDLNPVVFAAGRCVVLDARVRLMPRPAPEDVLRGLRG